jgi:hypothetical protein
MKIFSDSAINKQNKHQSSHLIHELTKRAGLCFSLSFYFFPINQTGADLYNAVSRSKMKNLKIPQRGKIRTVKLNRKKIKTSLRSKREKKREREREGAVLSYTHNEKRRE